MRDFCSQRTICPVNPLFRDKRQFASTVLVTMFGLGVAATACTPATADAVDAASGGQVKPGATGGATPAPTGTGGASVGSGGSVGPASGGSTGSGGSVVGQSGGAGGTGGSTTGSAGGPGGSVGSGGATTATGGKVGGATGGATGAAGAGAPSASGCNWVHAADGTWAFGTPAAADKIVLFDGTSLANWHSLLGPTVPAPWKLIGDGSMEVVPQATPTNIQSNMKFEDLCLHVEYMTPVFPSTTTDPQKQGNSGVYLKSAYEMQILDTHTSPPMIDGCGAVYKIRAPLVVACNMYLVWNTYEIEFKSSQWTGTTRAKDAIFVQVALNGKLVQMNAPLDVGMVGDTQAGIPDVPGPQPVALQDHRDLVRFRNVWATVPHY